jgi:hypothetical protein
MVWDSVTSHSCMWMITNSIHCLYSDYWVITPLHVSGLSATHRQKVECIYVANGTCYTSELTVSGPRPADSPQLNFLISLTSYPLAYEGGTDTVFRNVGYKHHTPGNNPKDYTQHFFTLSVCLRQKSVTDLKVILSLINYKILVYAFPVMWKKQRRQNV